ncbi:MAG: hypothetical protein ACKVQJ_03120 [Pyrinomonadaceae bacterium]
MRVREREFEQLCKTSEKGERLISRDELLPISLEIGRRILEVFGYQHISNIVFRLKSNSREIYSVINGETLPSTEMLLGIHKTTGASIDWLLTGNGEKYLPVLQIADHSFEPVPPALWFTNRELEISSQ